MPAGQSSSATIALDDESVLNLVERLEAEGRVVDVVRLTEKWGYGRTLPRAAMLSSARALLSLRLMDRALGRLRALTDANSTDIEALVLTAELMMERGWGARGLKLLEKVRALDPGHPLLEELTALADNNPQVLLANARKIERSGSKQELLRLAEVYLSTGSMLRGKNLLERLRRKWPDDTRVAQLLWGARGDLTPRPGSLMLLVEELAVDQDALRQEEWGSTEHTESRSMAEVTINGISPPTPLRGTGFPRLFRQDEEYSEIDDTAEVTIAAHMASGTELLDAPHEDVTESSLLDEDPDTKILDIITNRPEETAPPEPAHQAVDLRALQEQADPETDFIEIDNDDNEADLIVMKSSRPTPAPVPSTPRKRQRPIEVIEKHPVPTPYVPMEDDDSDELGQVSLPPPVRTAANGASPASAAANSSGSSAGNAAGNAAGELAGEDLSSDEQSIPSGHGSVLRPLLTVFSAAFVATLGVGGVYYGMQQQAGHQLTERTASALAEGDFGELRGLEVQLSSQVEDGQAPLGSRAAALALVEAVLWSEYTGDLEDRQQAIDALEVAEAAGASPESLAVARGTLALSVGDLGTAAELSATAPNTDEAAYLRARVALAAGKPDMARSVWLSPPPSGARYLALDTRLAGEGGYSIESASIEESIVAHELRWGELEAASRLRVIEELMAKTTRTLSPNQRARLYAVSASLNQELGRENLARVAWKKALESNPAHPRYLYEVSGREIAAGHAQRVLESLSQCHTLYAEDAACQRAYVAALLELDRLEEAQQAASGSPLLQAWVGVVQGDTAPIPEGDAPSGLRDYLQGLRAAAAGDTDTVESAMSIAQVALGTTPESELRYLSGRALAVLIEHGNPRLARQRVRELQALGVSDPEVHMRLSRYYRAVRQRREASQALSHATALTEERDSAVALYELGVLHAEAGQDAIAQGLWQRYLTLSPSGPRAAEATSTLSDQP